MRQPFNVGHKTNSRVADAQRSLDLGYEAALDVNEHTMPGVFRMLARLTVNAMNE